MSKSSKTWIYIVVNILCAALFFIGCCNSVLRSCALLIWAFSFVFLPYLAIINGISIYTVKKDKMKISAVPLNFGRKLRQFYYGAYVKEKIFSDKYNFQHFGMVCCLVYCRRLFICIC